MWPLDLRITSRVAVHGWHPGVLCPSQAWGGEFTLGPGLVSTPLFFLDDVREVAALTLGQTLLQVQVSPMSLGWTLWGCFPSFPWEVILGSFLRPFSAQALLGVASTCGWLLESPPPMSVTPLASVPLLRGHPCLPFVH